MVPDNTNANDERRGETADRADDAASGPERDERTGRAAAAARMQNQRQWVDLQITQAMQRGDFDDLPGYGKPIEDLGTQHDPDWWLKKLIERERVTGVLPAALQLRKEDLELSDVLDRLVSETDVRTEVESFNERIRQARFQLTGGPPVVTQMRDVDAEVENWRARRAARIGRGARSAGSGTSSTTTRAPAPGSTGPEERPRRRWFPRFDRRAR